MRRSLVTALALLVLAVAPSMPATGQGKTSLTFSAGPTGGNWTPLAVSVGDMVRRQFPDVDVQIEPGTTLANLEKLLTDRADLAWAVTPQLFEARTGKGRWQGRPGDKLMYVAHIYPTIWHLAVPASSDIRSIADLKGKNVALPQRASASMETFELLLKLSGLTLNDLGTKSYGSFVENVELIKNRNAVAMGWVVTAPAPFMLDLGAGMKVRLLPVPDDLYEKVHQANPGYLRHVIRKGTYTAQGVDEDVPTIQSPTVLLGSARTPADAVYKVTKAIVEAREQFGNVAAVMKGVTAAQLAQPIGVPYHPGAERYYREAGLLR
jgi:uncharacterized protein